MFRTDGARLRHRDLHFQFPWDSLGFFVLIHGRSASHDFRCWVLFIVLFQNCLLYVQGTRSVRSFFIPAGRGMTNPIKRKGECRYHYGMMPSLRGLLVSAGALSSYGFICSPISYLLCLARSHTVISCVATCPSKSLHAIGGLAANRGVQSQTWTKTNSSRSLYIHGLSIVTDHRCKRSSASYHFFKGKESGPYLIDG
jgi:hypothetical protein